MPLFFFFAFCKNILSGDKDKLMIFFKERKNQIVCKRIVCYTVLVAGRGGRGRL